MEVRGVKNTFIELFGKPEGIVLFQLLEATQFTIYLSLIAFTGGGILALVLAFMATVHNRVSNITSKTYIWFFQSTPLLMLLFLFGLGIPRLLGVNVNIWLAASVALVLYSSAYIGEVWRGSIESIPKSQWEAGEALGLSFFPIFFLIILPQAIRIAIAPTVGFMVQIVKGTSLAYIIGFHDLMSIGKRWANAPVTGTEPYVIFPLMALIYFSLCFPLSQLSQWLERKTKMAS
ncbi:ABC transporter permease subunit [Rhodobacteraceae bacterium IMCC15231]|nr:amino acid ABC transporter permease [Paracoccaceae bacterium]MED7678944.1 ABC transporter permease subunit [Rhodobacteraceae bacterium IMCC15231]